MPIDPTIALQASARPFDAVGAVQGAYRLKDLIDQSRLSQMKAAESADKLATGRRLRDLIPTLSDPFGKDANTLARVMAETDPEGAVKFQTGAVQYGKAQSDADKARIEAGLTQADAIARTVYGVRQLPPEQRAAAYAQSIPMLESMGLKPPAQWDEGVADQQLSLAMSVKQQLEEAARQRDDARQDMTARDLMRHRGVIEGQGERRLGMTADRNDALTSQGERRIAQVADGRAADDSRVTRDRVIAPILAKVSRGEPLTANEQQALELSSSPIDRMGRPRYRPPVARTAGPMLDANGNEPNPYGMNDQPTPTLGPKALAPRDGTPTATARTRTPPPRPVPGGRPAGARVRLPDGYTPARAVSEARAALKANPAARAQIAERLESYGINSRVLGK